MELYLAILTLAVCLSADAQLIHKDFKINGCTDTEKESLYGSDGEEIWHADFIQNVGVNTLPDFADPLRFPGFYELSIAEQETCEHNLAVCIEVYENPPEEMDPPETSVYTKNEVQLGVKNSLVCHVTGFFPPPVNMSWTKNNVIVTEGVSVSQYRPRSDGTFHIFSSLDIVPEEKDIYSCTVDHRALQGQAQTKIWGVPETTAVPSGLGPAVFCGAGFTLALLGVATGIFFFVKGAATDDHDAAKKEKRFMQWTYQ
ncbi:H-2 class II histocompatibility antigen, A-U alpha chain-like [Puntigrus tetrazona]|uniref:H-2 class II histocompatibility antigen, A-U alpha chain-like n=1 Tax=Puntigrus tetrazona TaxID=1606681 RepID=UPI001C8ACCEC|nr:H-2 class II histocompatibility antigen, A-U alpha chain-like [Puntigrus tetrazona]